MTTSPSVALVTGGSAGLGLALVRGLLDRGWSVIVDARGLRVAVEKLRGDGDNGSRALP